MALFLFLATLALLSSLARAGELRVVTTAHYQIHTDLDADLAGDCARRMDAMFDEYARRFAGVADLRNLPVFQVSLFRLQNDYLKLVGAQYQNTGGLFVPSRNFLAAFLEGQGRDTLRKTLQHEAFHQFVHVALPSDPPAWLNEGMAQTFEEGIWTGDEFWIGQVPPRRVRQLQADLKADRLVDFRLLATLSPEQWSDVFTGDRARAATRYNQAWATVYFLTHYKDAAGVEIYRPRLLKLFQLLHDKVDDVSAFDQVFPDVADVNKDFLAYAGSLQPTAEATLIERQSVLADLLIDLQLRQGPPSDISRARRALKRGGYRIRYSIGGLQWESDADVTRYFSDLTGRLFTRKELLLAPRPAAPLPDVVCRCLGRFEMRTRFHRAGDKVEHEMLIEPLGEE